MPERALRTLAPVPQAPRKPTRRLVLKSHSRQIEQDLREGRPTRWRSETPVADWFAQWWPALLAIGIRLFGLGLFAAAGWILMVWMLAEAPAVGPDGGCAAPCAADPHDDGWPRTNGSVERRSRR